MALTAVHILRRWREAGWHVEKWQPIDTAPRGIRLLFGEESNVTPGFWNEGEDTPRMFGGLEFVIFPTHWMPLPEPPKP